MVCGNCNIAISPRSASGKCRKCYMKEMRRTWYVQNMDKAKGQMRVWKRENRERANELERLARERDPEKSRARSRRYQKTHKGRIAAKRAKQRAQFKKATPIWLTQEQYREMVSFYEQCPVGCEVDHIVPLRGKNVRGLHVPWNLQYLSVSENRKKSNKFL